MVVMMDLDQKLFSSPQQQALVLLSVSIDNIMSFNIDVGVVINDYHHHLRGEGGGVFTTVMHVGHAYNGSTICIYPEQKTSARL